MTWKRLSINFCPSKLSLPGSWFLGWKLITEGMLYFRVLDWIKNWDCCRRLRHNADTTNATYALFNIDLWALCIVSIDRMFLRLWVMNPVEGICRGLLKSLYQQFTESSYTADHNCPCDTRIPHRCCWILRSWGMWWPVFLENSLRRCKWS
jgi:hypothetical protein